MRREEGSEERFFLRTTAAFLADEQVPLLLMPCRFLLLPLWLTAGRMPLPPPLLLPLPLRLLAEPPLVVVVVVVTEVVVLL